MNQTSNLKSILKTDFGRGFSEENYIGSLKAQQQQQNTETDVMVFIREDYKYQVIGRDCEKVSHSSPLSVLPREMVTVRNICPAH